MKKKKNSSLEIKRKDLHPRILVVDLHSSAEIDEMPKIGSGNSHP